MENNYGKVYTIGYSGFLLKDFIDVLKQMNIKIVIDVRSRPVSTYYTDYNKDVLDKELTSNHIHYKNYSREFGAWQTESCYFSDKGYLDFSKYVLSPQFKQGFTKIKTGLEAGYNFALMCAEKKPSMCHRTIMVARQFSASGIEVIHILPDNQFQSQADIEDELINLYFPNNNQLSLLSKPLSRSELVDQAYQMRNADIGFREEGVNLKIQIEQN